MVISSASISQPSAVDSGPAPGHGHELAVAIPTASARPGCRESEGCYPVAGPERGDPVLARGVANRCQASRHEVQVGQAGYNSGQR